ncbi:hypothetical protein SNEBB_011312 [Seison nebaliae]|nr:hypothetical protein SNEBB_011312 [Seison nebaliae]
MNRALKSGLGRSTQLKLLSKWNNDLAKSILFWIEEMTQCNIKINDQLSENADYLYDLLVFVLHDGIVLCRLIKSLMPNDPIIKFSEKRSFWTFQANIEQFLNAAQRYGVEKHELFQASDLSDAGDSFRPGGNLIQVLYCLTALNRKARVNNVKMKFQIAPKESVRNPRKFSPNTLLDCQRTPSRQMGVDQINHRILTKNLISSRTDWNHDYEWNDDEISTPVVTSQEVKEFYENGKFPLRRKPNRTLSLPRCSYRSIIHSGYERHNNKKPINNLLMIEPSNEYITQHSSSSTIKKPIIAII